MLAGHLGMDKTLSRLKECFCWPGHYNHVENWCRNCAKCARRKTPVPNTRAPLQSIKAGYPMQIVAADILGPFPESENENNYILVVGNYLTHWVEVYGIHNQEAVTDANKITNEFSFVSSQWSSCILITEWLLRYASCLESTNHAQHHIILSLMAWLSCLTLLNMLASTAEKHPFDWESQLWPLCLMSYGLLIKLINSQ